MHGKRVEQRGESEDQQNIDDIGSDAGTDGNIDLPVQRGGGGDDYFRQRCAYTDNSHANNQRWDP